MLNSEKDGGDRDEEAADDDETSALPAQSASRNSRQDPAAAAERHLAENNRPRDSGTALDCSREMNHGYKEEHHDPEQQAGPLHLNPGGNAQRRGNQRTTH